MNTVSVVIPCFNAGLYLRSCVASAIAQKGAFEILEILVIDDESTDPHTRNVLRDVESLNTVKVLKNKGLRGAAGARNTGLAYARSTWVAFLDADDWWPVDSLSRRFEALAECSEATWIGGDFCDVQEGSEPSHIGRFSQRLASYPFLTKAYEPTRRPILLRSPLELFLAAAPTCTITTLIRRDVLRTHGGFAERLLRAQDFHLWVRLAADVPFLFVPYVLGYYRHHDSNSTKSASHTLEWRATALRDLLRLNAMASVRTTLLNQLASTLLSLSYEYRKERRFLRALASGLGALVCGPPKLREWKTVFASILRKS